MRIRNLITLGMVGFLLLITAGFTYFIYQMQRSSYESGIDRELLTAANLARDVLPANYHDQITGKGSVTDAEYLQIVDRFNTICQETGMEYLWSLMILDGKIVFTSGTSPGKDASQRDQAAFLEVHSNPELYTQAFETMQPQFQVSEDKWGRIRAVLVPFTDSQGRKYLVGASRKMQEIDAHLRGLLKTSLLIGVSIIVVGALISFILANSLDRPINVLTKAASKLAAGDYSGGSPLSPHGLTYNEVASLENSFDLMKEAVRSREDSLQKSEDLLDITQQLTHVGGWEFDVVQQSMRWTDEVYRIHGFSPEDILPGSTEHIQKSILCYDPNDRPIVQAAFEDCIGKGLPYDLEFPFTTHRGERIWIRTQAEALLENEKVVRVVGSIMDITERKQVEEALREGESRFRSLYENINEGVALHEILTDDNNVPVDFIFLSANPTYEKLTGLHAVDIVGKRGLEVIPNLEKKWIDAYGKVAQTGQPNTIIDHSNYLDKYWEVKAFSTKQDQFAVAMSDITERVRVEKALRESEERYRGLLSNLGAGVVVHAPDTSIVMSNPKASELLGLSEDQMRGKLAISPQWEFLYENGSPIPIEEYPVNIIVSNRQAINYLVLGINRPATKDVVWVSVNGFPVFDNKSDISEIVISFLDITERKQAEEEARASQARLLSIFDSIDEPIYVADPKTYELLFANQALELLFGPANNRMCYQYIQHRESPCPFCTNSKIFGEFSGRSYVWEFQNEVAQGWYRCIDKAIPWPDGRMVRYEMAIDITERKQAEQLLRDNKDRSVYQAKAIANLAINDAITQGNVADSLQVLMEVTAEVTSVERASVWLFSDDGRELQCKELYEASLKRHSAGLVLKTEDYPNYFSIIHTQNRICADDAMTDPQTSEFSDGYFKAVGITSMLDAGIHVSGRLAGVVCLEHTGEKRTWLPEEESFASTVATLVTQTLVNAERRRAEEQVRTSRLDLQSMLEEAELSRQSLLSVVEDQKEGEEHIRQLNAELEQRVVDRTVQLTASNQELEAFSYSVSHDLRAPLRALDGFSGLLLAEYQDKLDKDGQHYLTRIQEASHRMAQLIEDLLNLSRITRREFDLTFVDLNPIARQIADELQAQAPERKLEFEISSDLIARADPDLMKIALENLLRNAVKFTGKRELAHIQVGMLKEGSVCIYFVRDNGAGFDMAYADKLFSPFQRLHRASEYPGTGIGLTIVQRIIARHGGRIWPESAVDQGTTFYFTLEGEK